MAVKLEKGTALGALSLTPLIDIVFLLLIFFLVATRFAEEDREMDVDLPTASEAKPLIMQPKEIFVNVNKDGDIYLSGDQYNLSQLEERLEQAVRNNPTNQSVIIRADKHASFQAVVGVINVCNKTGAQHTVNIDKD